ncbi:MAG: hypothetical protein JRJ45_00065 [Deltaproteobacteria bacterium]|nr:hypothetical protein [Deltaproteobacteria bacterium]
MVQSAKIPSRVETLKTRVKDNEAIKQHWHNIWEFCGEYVHTRKQHFLSTPMPGEFLTEQLYSTVAPQANNAMASALIGQLWPNGARSVRLARPKHIPDTKENKDFYKEITNRFTGFLDQPEANLVPALAEYMFDQGAFGIAGIHRKRTTDFMQPLKFFPVSVKNFLVEENKEGRIVSTFIDDFYTVRQLVETFGIKNVSKDNQDKYLKGMFHDKIRVMQVVEPRMVDNPKYQFGNKAMPISSIHFEWDTSKILRESGFLQPPLIVSRIAKAMTEVYGRSPSMFAMPAILRLNLIMEILMKNSEKVGSPPLYLLDNGALGPSIVDTSADALNVFQTSGLGEKAPIGQINDVGDLRPLLELAKTLQEEISKAFMIDRLLDFNNETRMTLGEAQIRDRIRGDANSALYKRQMNELFTPLLQGAFNDLFDMGHMGVVRGSDIEKEIADKGLEPLYFPDAVRNAIEKDLPIYEIEYISPAARVMKTEEMQGLTTFLDIAIGAGQAFPEGLHNVNIDEIIKQAADLTNIGEDKLNDMDTVKAIREGIAEANKAAAQQEQIAAAADAGMKGAQAQSMMIGAMSDRPAG